MLPGLKPCETCGVGGDPGEEVAACSAGGSRVSSRSNSRGLERARGREPASDGDGIMPLYEYELCEGKCVVCGGRFTLHRPVTAAPLTHCPACKKPVRKVISGFSTPKLLRPLSVSEAKTAGFTVLKRVGRGEYERQ